MLYLAIAFFLALTPLAVHFGIGDGIRTPKEIASIAGFICIILIGLNYTKRPFKNKFLLFFWGWCFFVTTVNTHTIPMFLPHNIILNMPAPFFAWKELYYITLVIFTIYTISTVSSLSTLREYRLNTSVIRLKNSSYEEEIRGFADIINWVLIIISVYAVIQALGLDNFFRATSGQIHADGSTPIAVTNTDPKFPFTHRVVGTIGNPSLLATWVAMCLPFTLYLRRKRGYAGFLLGAVILVITQSSTAIIAVASALLFYLAFRYRKKFLCVFIPFLVLLSILVWANSGIISKQMKEEAGFFNPTGRINIHKETWKILRHRPLLGWGLGTFEYMIGLNPDIQKKMDDDAWRELHDEYGQIWFSVGMIGLAFFLLFMFTAFWGFLRNQTPETITLASALLTFLIISVTLFPMRVAPTSFYGAVFIGLLLRGYAR